MNISIRALLRSPRCDRLATIVLLVSAVLVASACATSGSQRTVEVPSANQDSRVNVLVLHHTSEDFGGSLSILTEPSKYPVSSHYLVPEPLDPSYSEEGLKVYSCLLYTSDAADDN